MVGIVVDQLRTDYIEYLQNYFTERGFKTLLNEGVYMRDVDFRVPGLDAVNSTALLFTGSYPSQTGVPAASVIDTENALTSAVRPPLAPLKGNSITNDSFTPEGLRLTTVADELAVDGCGTSKIYSVAMDPQQAVIMAGHAGTGAVWVNNSSGNWATSTWYGSLPAGINSRNMREPLSQRIDTMVWRPSGKLNSVDGLPEKKRLAPFKHTFSRQDRDVYKKFASSALSNNEVTDVAINLLYDQHLGSTPGEIDMLNVAYTVAPYKYTADGHTRMELTDSYLKLDAQLARLFTAIDKAVGPGNSLIWLTSTGYFDDAVATEPKYRLPGGEFSTRKARSLLNSYLSAKYGSAEYIQAIRDGRIYFSRRALEAPNLDAGEVVENARNFIVKMSGVADAVTLDEVLSPSTPEQEALRLAVDPSQCGEIILKFTPGWEVVYDEQIPPVTKSTRESAVMTPAFIKMPGVNKQTINTPVEAVRLAPTVAGALRIRAPNGARSRALGF